MPSFKQPSEVDKLSTAFGGDLNLLLPRWNEIPEEFRDSRTPWNEVFSKWFFSGLPENTAFNAKEGINAETAFHHIVAIMRSWEPKHEHKEAGCAYLMSLWFESIVTP